MKNQFKSTFLVIKFCVNYVGILCCFCNQPPLFIFPLLLPRNELWYVWTYHFKANIWEKKPNLIMWILQVWKNDLITTIIMFKWKVSGLGGGSSKKAQKGQANSEKLNNSNVSNNANNTDNNNEDNNKNNKNNKERSKSPNKK